MNKKQIDKITDRLIELEDKAISNYLRYSNMSVRECLFDKDLEEYDRLLKKLNDLRNE